MDLAEFNRILLVLLTNNKNQQKMVLWNGASMYSLLARLHSGTDSTHCGLSGVGSAGHAVVGVELGLDLADVAQQLIKHSVSVSPVAGVDATHSLGRVAVHLYCTVAMRTKGLEAQMAFVSF